MPFTGVPGLGDAKPRAEQRGRAHPLAVHHGWWGVHHRGRAGRLLRPDWEAEAGCVSGEKGCTHLLVSGNVAVFTVLPSWIQSCVRCTVSCVRVCHVCRGGPGASIFTAGHRQGIQQCGGEYGAPEGHGDVGGRRGGGGSCHSYQPKQTQQHHHERRGQPQQ